MVDYSTPDLCRHLDTVADVNAADGGQALNSSARSLRKTIPSTFVASNEEVNFPAAYFCLFFLFHTAPQSSPFGLWAVLTRLWSTAAMLCVVFMHYQFVKYARAWDLATGNIKVPPKP